MKNKFFFLLLILMLTACRKNDFIEPESKISFYEKPQQMEDGWITARASNVGLNESKLNEMIEYLNENPEHKIHSILIAKSGKLIFEKYFHGLKYNPDKVPDENDIILFGPDTLHYLASISKSINSMLYGIIRDTNFSLDTSKVITYFLDHIDLFDDQKKQISIHNLLTMSAGLGWNETSYPYGSIQNDATRMLLSNNPIEFILNKSMVDFPGNSFNYNSGLSQLLGNILEKLKGKPYNLLLEQNIFDKLDIKKYKIDKLNNGSFFTGGGLYLTPRNLLKIGEVYLKNGKWKNQQILSQEWIDESFTTYFPINYYYFADGYGYNWWHYNFNTIYGDFSCFFASGWGAQFLFVFPELDMSIVIFSGLYYDLNPIISPHELVESYILYSLIKTEELNEK